MKRTPHSPALTRREFTRLAAAGVAGAAVAGPPLWAQEPVPDRPVLCRATSINGERLWQSLMDLSRFGRNPEGQGTSRLGFSAADLEARNWLLSQLYELGLEVTIDAAANIRARRPGQDNDLEPLLFGSHIDTVPQGGNFDGCVGSMSALEVMRSLEENGIETRRPLEMIVFTNEEGVHYGQGLFGSRALAGAIEPEVLDLVDDEGVRLSEWIRRYGGDPERIEYMSPLTGTIHAYVELHIEQGGTLASRNIPLGIVEGIVGILEYKGIVEGFANHAGTTPMNLRRDALLTASKIVQLVNEVVTAEPGRQVGTVGYIKAEPGAPNVVPARAEFTIELRDLSMEKIEQLAEVIRERGGEIARSMDTEFRMEHVATYQPALSNRLIRFHVQKAAEEMRAPALVMPSGAGHDAQYMARLCPIGMIFVPSQNGISHSPEEYTRPEHVACGCECLYRTLVRLDQVNRIS